MSIEPTRASVAYGGRSGPSVVRHGGRYLARSGGRLVTLEGNWEPDRLVVIELESVEAARAWYDSDDFRGSGGCATAQVNGSVVVEEVEQPAAEPPPEP